MMQKVIYKSGVAELKYEFIIHGYVKTCYGKVLQEFSIKLQKCLQT
jgi:hypothetical protein